MTVAELRFRFNNKDGIDKWITNYIEYLEKIIKNIDERYLLNERPLVISQNDYIRFLENKIVELTRDK